MKLGFALAAALVSVAGVASAQTFVKAIDLTSNISTAGVHLAHIDVDNTGATPILYVTTLNNSGATQTSIPVFKIADPLGATPAVTTFASITGGGLGVNSTRGSGGIAVDGSGNVFVSSTGNGNDASSVITKYNSAGVAQSSWNFVAGTGNLQDRTGGIDVNSAGTHAIGARFLNTSTQKVAFYELTTPDVVRNVPVTNNADAGTTDNPRDVAYDPNTGAIYINANAVLEKLAPTGTGVDITSPSSYAAATSTSAFIQPASPTAFNSHAAHGVGVNALGTLIGFTPNPSAGQSPNVAYIVNPSGAIQYTLGTLNTPATGAGDTTGNIGRATDVAFFTVGGTEYVAVPDIQNATTTNTWNRVVIYSLATSNVSEWMQF